MKTLGEYSRRCREFDIILESAAHGIKNVPALSDMSAICYSLEYDGLVEITHSVINVGSKNNPIKRREITEVRITPKGRELLNRGGYSNFDTDWQPSLLDKY